MEMELIATHALVDLIVVQADGVLAVHAALEHALHLVVEVLDVQIVMLDSTLQARFAHDQHVRRDNTLQLEAVDVQHALQDNILQLEVVDAQLVRRVNILQLEAVDAQLVQQDSIHLQEVVHALIVVQEHILMLDQGKHYLKYHNQSLICFYKLFIIEKEKHYS